MDNESKSYTKPQEQNDNIVPNLSGDPDVLLGTHVTESDGSQQIENTTTVAGTSYTTNYEPHIESFGAPKEIFPFTNSLEREIKVTEISITCNGSFTDTSLDIWSQWWQHPFIQDKIRNFAYLKCNLHVRFVPSFSPFHYGKALIVYSPYNSISTVAKTPYDTSITAGTEKREFALQYYSCFPIKGYLNAADNNVVEMTIPFMSCRNYVSVAETLSPRDVDKLGDIHFMTMNRFLRANPNATSNARVAVFVRATDVQVSVPTALEPTAGKAKPQTKKRVTFKSNGSVKDETDEAATGLVSGPASAIAKAADALATIPVIGKFARATSIGAGAVSSIARLFGFSNPAMIAASSPVTLKLFSNIATTVGGSSSVPLSLDPKCEITIDPTVIGADSKDDMAISAIVQREQWIGKGKWTDAVGQFITAGATSCICSVLVNPTVCRRDTSRQAGMDIIQLTPAGYIGEMFRFWRGSIFYRIEVVASKYHAGALLIAFDPLNSLVSTTIADVIQTDVTRRSTVILDLAEAHEVELEVNYISSEIFLRNRSILNNSFAPWNDTTTTFDLNSFESDETDMGMLTVTVLNRLTAPGDTTVYSGDGAGVDVNVFMRCGPDMQFAQPSSVDGWENFSFTPTSGNIAMVDAPHDDDMLTCFGEKILSIRSLLKRSCVVYMKGISTTSSSANAIAQFKFPHFSPEHLPSGSFSNCYESFLAPCYFAKRGGMRWKFVFDNSDFVSGVGFLSNDSSGVAIISRNQSDSAVTWTPAFVYSGTWSTSVRSLFPSGAQGAEITHLAYKPAVDIQSPFYSSNRFALAGALNSVTATHLQVNPTMDQVLYTDISAYSAGGQTMKITALASAAEDYNLIMFLGPPPIYYPSP